MTTTGEYLIKLLETYEVDTIFGIPGVHTVELYRGLQQSTIRHITPRHEQGAGFMADGYARVSGKPGVCFIITGPGMTNIATAMGQAYGDSIPMLVISTVNEHGRMGSGDGWLHELPNQQGIFNKLTAFSTTVNAPEELARALARAFAVFDSARPRPVHIELPINVVLASAAHLPVPATQARLARPEPNKNQIADAADLISRAVEPVILAGGGAVHAADALRAFAEKIDAPVVMTGNARGLLPPRHPLAISLSPTYPATRELVRQADLVLAIGTELGPTDYDMFEDGGFSIAGILVRIDIDPLQATRGKSPDLAIVGDSTNALVALFERVEVGQRGAEARVLATLIKGLEALPQLMRNDIRILEAIRDALGDPIIVGDSTQLVYSGNSAFESADARSWFNCATGYGTLGYGLPAALGAKAAVPGRAVVALAGDGGILFSLSEMAVAVESGLPITLLLHENGGYGEIKSYMVARDIEPIGVDLLAPDFQKIAEGFGWKAVRVSSLDELVSSTITSSKSSLPTIVIFDENVRANVS